jgi:hypothetical protein
MVTAEVTESLDEYTTFASLPKRLNQVFLKVKKNFARLDKARTVRPQFTSPSKEARVRKTQA